MGYPSDDDLDWRNGRHYPPVVPDAGSLEGHAREIREMQVAAFGDDPESRLIQALVLCEEAGEVGRVAAKERQGIRLDTRGRWADELGDVLLVALGLCALVEVDPDAALRNAKNRLSKRTAKQVVEP